MFLKVLMFVLNLAASELELEMFAISSLKQLLEIQWLSPLVVDPVSLGLFTAISEASRVHCCPGSLSTIVVPVRPVFENRWCDPGKRLFCRRCCLLDVQSFALQVLLWRRVKCKVRKEDRKKEKERERDVPERSSHCWLLVASFYNQTMGEEIG